MLKCFYRTAYGSKISLTSPDPSQNTQNSLHSAVTSQSNTVTYIPKHKSTPPPKNTPKTFKHKNHVENGSAEDEDSEENVIHLGTVEDVTHLYAKKDEL